MTFEMEIRNVPIVNLRKEFFHHHNLIHSEEFKEAAFNSAVKPVQLQLPPILRSGMPNDLLTLMIQRAIGGLEAYIVAAAEYELSKVGKFEDHRRNLDNPFRLDKSAVKALYDCVPKLVSEDVMLSKRNSVLYEKTQEFYKQIRNPIFHGKQLVCSYENYPMLMNMFSHMRLLYSWVDEWYSAFPIEEARF